MNIFGQATITGQGVILSGFYTKTVTGQRKPKLFEISSPSQYPVGRFTAPYDAILKNATLTGGDIVAVGRRVRSSSEPISSDRSGAFFYNDVAELIGTCHGYGRTDATFFSGYNFYNSPYPVGYFTPPFGETTSLFTTNQNGFENLAQGGCSNLSITEYNEQFGIVSIVAPDASASSSTLFPNSFTQIMSLKETCPDGTIAVSTYYEEVNLKRAAGTVAAITSPTFYNNNFIPTSLDNYDNWVNGRYSYTANDTLKINSINFTDGRPIPSYSTTDTNHSKLNNNLCQAQLFETDTSAGKLSNGLQRIVAPDALFGSIGDQVSAVGQEPWHYWHFTFRENAETLPFDSDFKAIRPGVTHRTISEGTQMFTPVLSSEDMYWQNRQCPDTVDFLPYTFGASIYACPSEHFDIPYYAALKKFGFYGVRFLNSCTRLDLQYSINGVPNALELTDPTDIDYPDVEPEDIDLEGSWTFPSYDNLLRTATAEERYSNMYAGNKGFFLWMNTGCYMGDIKFTSLVNGYAGFSNLFASMIQKFQSIFPNGISSFLSGDPRVIIKQGQGSASEYFILDSGKSSDLLFTNSVYLDFERVFKEVVSGDGISYWNDIESNYSYYISNCSGNINESVYQMMSSGREKRIRTRYFENLVRGNPIDLFPLNHIYFGTDQAREYYESTGWARSAHGFGESSKLPPISRRYFEGAYGNVSLLSGVVQAINSITIAKDSSFYPGFFNTYGFGKMTPTPTYIPVLSGYITDTAHRKYSASGWLAAGYNEVGKLDSNFSCFTPIIVQQPLRNIFCKVGQHPTLRVTAVDYHSIPEDKISFRYPEIIYWTHKLKLSDKEFKNKYRLSYQWFRVAKTDYDEFATTSDFSLASFSNPTGEWCALEGDNRTTCTIIHPTECYPAYSSHNEDSYTFIQGVKKDVDDQFYYYCLVKGRFGVRLSEPTQLILEDWVMFDISHKNGTNTAGALTIKFTVNDINGNDNEITFKGTENPAYKGYQRDETAIPEGAVEQKAPPPNAGFGDVFATKFVGPYGYVGATRSYAPDVLKDTRGLRETWGSMLEYGSLISFKKNISQREGDLLYGYKALPTCTNYQMDNGQKGIRVTPYYNDNKITHWTLQQQAFAALDNRYGMKWDKLGHVGNLYPPASTISEIKSPSVMGIGHGQWGVNLGSIKRFGKFSQPEDNDLVLLGQGFSRSNPVSQEWLDKIKDKFIQPSTLAGENCGYTKYGLGRNMLYYIEAFDRFYFICDTSKKKNVANTSFMCPGLRFMNSATQYFWLGQPSNTYLERRAMYGPYAYQWRVKRHNRDRNGNGMSQGFYSPSYDTRYELMYDAPAIYGLYVKRDSSSEYTALANTVIESRKKIFGDVNDFTELRSYWFGEAGSEGTARRYGDFTFSCDPNSHFFNQDLCDYVSAAKALADAPDFRAYSCPQDILAAGECFDPCLSIRYGQGFFPGGKVQSMFGYSPFSSYNTQQKNVRLVPVANLGNTEVSLPAGFKQFPTGDYSANMDLKVTDEQSQTDPSIYFRPPLQTPHARRWRGFGDDNATNNHFLNMVVGVSPCADGGSDHCNYLTPTINFEGSSDMLGESSGLSAAIGFAANVIQTSENRGEDTSA